MALVLVLPADSLLPGNELLPGTEIAELPEIRRPRKVTGILVYAGIRSGDVASREISGGVLAYDNHRTGGTVPDNNRRTGGTIFNEGRKTGGTYLIDED